MSTKKVHDDMKFRQKTLLNLADMICGNCPPDKTSFFEYRSSFYLTSFFKDCGTEYVHDGSTRQYWVANILAEILNSPQSDPDTPPDLFLTVVQVLMDRSDALNEDGARLHALEALNVELAREGLKAFYADDGLCYLKMIKSNKTFLLKNKLNRPLSHSEELKKNILSNYIKNISEDELIEKILLPLFRQLNFLRVTPAGHSDKALEYGKDIWMKFQLPTSHYLYFGAQVKRGKLDASGRSKGGNTNIAEILNQVNMMLGHELFDPEINKKVLVDHAFIISGGDITKAARNWIGERLDSSSRSQILFMDQSDILDLFILNNVQLPQEMERLFLAQTNKVDNDMQF